MKPEDYDILANELGLDILVDAEAIIKESSPTGTRQVVRKLDADNAHVPLTFDDMVYYATKDPVNTHEYNRKPQPYKKLKSDTNNKIESFLNLKSSETIAVAAAASVSTTIKLKNLPPTPKSSTGKPQR